MPNPINDRTENRSRVRAASRYAVLAAVLCAAEIYVRCMGSPLSRMDDAARIPIVLAAIALAGITALLASGFSASARDSTPVCAWRRAWGYSRLLPAGFGTAHRQPGLPYEDSNILVHETRLRTGSAVKIGNRSGWRTHERETRKI
jgi:hypothetical protein